MPAEAMRLGALHSYGILDTPREGAFDDITRLAALICGAPMALVSLVDRERQWFKSEIGIGISETPISSSICAMVWRASARNASACSGLSSRGCVSSTHTVPSGKPSAVRSDAPA